jgi:hypothetical protein
MPVKFIRAEHNAATRGSFDRRTVAAYETTKVRDGLSSRMGTNPARINKSRSVVLVK